MKSQFVLAAFATCFTICAGAPPLFPIGDSHNEDVNQIGRQELVDRAGDGATNQYWLFTRQNPTNKQILVHNDHRSVLGSNYDGGRGTVVLAHGWRNDGNTDMNPLITAAFLDVMDVNVIVLDWSYSCNGFYTRASIAVPSVGNYLGDFIMWLFNSHGGDWDQLHLVGFSLGAHVVGNAGRRVGGRAARVTGLDPASFSWGGNQYALNTESGRYVEVIHTDGRICGIMDAIGHSDFYPNGGQHPQPGCWFNPCSHGRVTEYFASSVRNPNHFVARGCKNKYEAELGRCAGDEVVMGNGDVKKFASGLFGLWTTDRYPF